MRLSCVAQHKPGRNRAKTTFLSEGLAPLMTQPSSRPNNECLFQAHQGPVTTWLEAKKGQADPSSNGEQCWPWGSTLGVEGGNN